MLERLHFLDEFGAHLGMTRTYGRAAPGKRVVEATPDYSGPHYTVVATISLAGVVAPWVFEGAMNGAFLRRMPSTNWPRACKRTTSW